MARRFTGRDRRQVRRSQSGSRIICQRPKSISNKSLWEKPAPVDVSRLAADFNQAYSTRLAFLRGSEKRHEYCTWLDGDGRSDQDTNK